MLGGGAHAAAPWRDSRGTGFEVDEGGGGRGTPRLQERDARGAPRGGCARQAREEGRGGCRGRVPEGSFFQGAWNAAGKARLASPPRPLWGARVSARFPWRREGGGRGPRGKEVSDPPRCGARPRPRRRWVRSAAPRPAGHGVPRPEPLGLRAGPGTARRRALTAACPAPGGAEAAPRAAPPGCSSRSTTSCCP